MPLEVPQPHWHFLFFIYNFNSSNNVFLGRRYFGDFQFCINYFPNKGNEKSECHEVGERLFKCLEVIEVDGHLQRGWNMKYDILDSVLNFYVNYKTFNIRSQSDTYMEDIKNNIMIKRWGELKKDVVGEVKESTVVVEDNETEVEVRFTKEQIINSKMFSSSRDILTELLDVKQRYKISEVKDIIDVFMKREVV